MNDLMLIRLDQNGKRTLGKIMINEEIFCFSLEPPWKNNETAVSCIPVGRYKYRKYASKKYKRVCLALYDVPDRKYIAVHNGNYPKNTKGCILTGFGLNVNSTTASRFALEKLIPSISFEGYLTITTIYED